MSHQTITRHHTSHSVIQRQGDTTMRMTDELKEEMNDDLAEARHYDRKRWYVRKILPDGKKDWKNGFVDKYNQPLYDGTGTYIPRRVRNKIRNEKEIYYRQHPKRSVWKTNLTTRERNKLNV